VQLTNRAEPQRVQIRGLDDDQEDGDHVFCVLTAWARSLDPRYHGIKADNVSFTNLDDDGPSSSDGGSLLTTAAVAGPVTAAEPATVDPVDVNRDGLVTPLDALLIINALNQPGAPQSTADLSAASFSAHSVDTRLDVNGDAHATPLDALIVINRLNAATTVASVSAEDASSHVPPRTHPVQGRATDDRMDSPEFLFVADFTDAVSDEAVSVGDVGATLPATRSLIATDEPQVGPFHGPVSQTRYTPYRSSDPKHGAQGEETLDSVLAAIAGDVAQQARVDHPLDLVLDRWQ